MKKARDKNKSYGWFTADFYPDAYRRFNRLRWGVEKLNRKYYYNNLDPQDFHPSEKDLEGLLLAPFYHGDVELSILSLVGQINRFNSDLFAIKVWKTILPDYTRDQQRHLVHEFVESLSYACMFAPFALKNQIIFTGTKTAILFERGKGALKLPDDYKISMDHFRDWAGKWKGFPQVERWLKKLNDEKFILHTNNFRNRYTHRIPPRIEFGLSPNFRFELKNKLFTIYLSPEKPLRLSQSLNASIRQHKMCVKAFLAFWKMIKMKLYAR